MGSTCCKNSKVADQKQSQSGGEKKGSPENLIVHQNKNEDKLNQMVDEIQNPMDESNEQQKVDKKEKIFQLEYKVLEKCLKRILGFINLILISSIIFKDAHWAFLFFQFSLQSVFCAFLIEKSLQFYNSSTRAILREQLSQIKQKLEKNFANRQYHEYSCKMLKRIQNLLKSEFQLYQFYVLCGFTQLAATLYSFQYFIPKKIDQLNVALAQHFIFFVVIAFWLLSIIFKSYCNRKLRKNIQQLIQSIQSQQQQRQRQAQESNIIIVAQNLEQNREQNISLPQSQNQN